MTSQRQQLDALLDDVAPVIAAAFRASIEEIKSQVTLAILVDRLKAGDIEGALDALHMDRAAFGALDDAISTAFRSGGALMTSSLPTLRGVNGAKIVVRFNARDLRAEAWLREHSSQLIADIIDDQRVAIRAVLTQGMAAGKNPTSTALDFVGRMSRVSGRREGGIIGLTSQQADYVATAKAELSSGNPEKLKHYLTRGRRDKRFDRTVEKAIREGKPVPKEIADKATQRYADNLLKLRGDTIGRTESLESIHAGGFESIRQAMETAGVADDDLEKGWDDAGDKKVRHTHSALGKIKVRGLETPFTSPSGAMMRFPGDRKLGAPAKELIACRCRPKYRFLYIKAPK